jgi:hypothetical protein
MEEDYIKKRIGRFAITSNIIEDPKNRNILSILFSKVIVVEAVMKFYNNSIEYTAMSEYFDEIEDGCKPYWYKVILDNDSILFKNIEKK